MDDYRSVTHGFLGLGAMGGPMALNLVHAGLDLVVFDPSADRAAPLAAAGARAAADEAAVAAAATVVWCSLPSSHHFVDLAERILLPHARAGQVIGDLGTTTAPETRRLAAAFAARGAQLLDVPVSGGPGGAAAGNLRLFGGGDRATWEALRPVLEILGDPAHLVWCGPSGAGQVVKGVNQLAMALPIAGYLEALALAHRAGVDLEPVLATVGGDAGWRRDFAAVARRVLAGDGRSVEVKFTELEYFLATAAEQGFELPLTQALFNFCDRGERVVTDVLHRPSPSFWHELTQSRREPDGVNGL